ncbi:MAG: response regulator [Prolixibacteraceae bacterium]|nr:response regulator [Prolixibacteraceae bacterium]
MTKILIIEDTAQLRESIADVLEQEGYEVVNAADGYSGVKMAREHCPDLILCDIVMPGMTGFDVIQLLKSEEGQLSVPFIYITALAERRDFREGMNLGADDYLVKPFTIQELLSAINTRLEKYNSVEKRIKFQIEKIENELKARISELKLQTENQKLVIDDISSTNAQVMNQLNEKQAQLMHEALRSIEVNTTLQYLAKHLSEEIKRKGIDDQQRLVLIDLRNKIRKGSVLLNNWTVFQLKFNQTYPNFTSRLMTRYPQLTQQDLIIISALYINLNTHQLSVILGISPDSVRKSKYRLKKKLGLGKDVDLSHAIHELNLND